jgi:hypothetical protein
VLVIRRLVGLAAAAALLAACAVQQQPRRWNELPADATGTFFGTLTLDTRGRHIENLYLGYRNLDTGESGTVRLARGIFGVTVQAGPQAPPEINQNDQLGRLFVVRVPPGNYAITGLGMVNVNMSGFRVPQGGTGAISLPFKVETGSTLYVGEYRAIPASFSLFSRPREIDRFAVIDSFDRDRALLLRVNGGTDPARIVRGVPDTSAAGHAFRPGM